jgi:Subtilase family
MKKLLLFFIAFWVVATLQGQQPETNVPGHNFFVNRINVLHHFYPYWDGSGRVLSLKENPFDAADVDLKGRVLPFSEPVPGTDIHALLMATQALGAGNGTNSGRGVARGALLYGSPFAPLLPEADSVYKRLGISVQNHSYGSTVENTYSSAAAAYDASVAQNTSLLHVFSAGNDGIAQSPNGKYKGIAGYGNLTGSFKMAKNVLCIGALDSFANSVPFSSKGPAHDGRLKPDLAAFGADGTSSAAAIVSGTALVLQQIYAEQNGENLPPAALVRALLCNNTDDVGPIGPDWISGYGSLNAIRPAQTVLNSQYKIDKLSAKSVYILDLPIGQSVANLQIMLCWDEPPAVPSVAKALLHDLDLQVIAPNGEVCLPLVLNAAPHLDSLRQAAQPGKDTLNNTEQVRIQNPKTGSYRIMVSASDWSDGMQQSFSLCWRTDTADLFKWNSPLRSDPLEAGKESILFWENALPDTLVALEFKRADAANWSLVNAAINLKKGYFRWKVPDIFGAAQLRIKTSDSQVFETDTFLISRKITPRIGFDCDDELMLFWSSVGEKARYQLHGLGDRYLQPFGLPQKDTFVVLPKALFPQRRFAVTVLSPEGIEGGAYNSVDYTLQGVGCYLFNFSATAAADQATVLLQLETGTDYGLESVQFERSNGGAFSAIKTISAKGNRYTFYDTEATKGYNLYRATLKLANGNTVTSDSAVIVFAPENQHFVYPNPLHAGSGVYVLASIDTDASFMLYDIHGKLLLEKPLEGYRSYYELPPAQAGVYFYQIGRPGRVYFSGKLVVMP